LPSQLRVARGAATGAISGESLTPLVDAVGEGLAPLAAVFAGPLGVPFRVALSVEQLGGTEDDVMQQQRHATRGLAASHHSRSANWLFWPAFRAHYTGWCFRRDSTTCVNHSTGWSARDASPAGLE